MTMQWTVCHIKCRSILTLDSGVIIMHHWHLQVYNILTLKNAIIIDFFAIVTQSSSRRIFFFLLAVCSHNGEDLLGSHRRSSPLLLRQLWHHSDQPSWAHLNAVHWSHRPSFPVQQGICQQSLIQRYLNHLLTHPIMIFTGILVVYVCDILLYWFKIIIDFVFAPIDRQNFTRFVT